MELPDIPFKRAEYIETVRDQTLWLLKLHFYHDLFFRLQEIVLADNQCFVAHKILF